MEYQIVWFILWAVLWAVYFMLDGFDFGVGMIFNFIGKSEKEKSVILRTIEPVWDGNEVWLVTAGGATFAAFPGAYAAMFSYLYSALFMVLFFLIIRGVAIEFRRKVESVLWRKFWDICMLIGSVAPAFLFGTAFGNIFAGLPVDTTGYHGSFLSLLNIYGLVTGALFTSLFIMHGALWTAFKTSGIILSRASRVAEKFWHPFFIIFICFVMMTFFFTNITENYINNISLCIIPITAIISVLSIMFFIKKDKIPEAFIASCFLVVSIVFTGIAGLFPNIIPSNISQDYSVTIYNSSSSPYTLKIMTIVALVFVPIVIIYQSWVYRIFKNKSTEFSINL